MVYKTIESVLTPDGHLALSPEERPDHPVRVMVTILESDEDASLAEPGDYLDQLASYEDRLARGEIRWQ